MDNNSSGNFLDKNTIVAIVLCLVLWLGWSQYLQNKYPDMDQAKSVPTDQVATGANSSNLPATKGGQLMGVSNNTEQEPSLNAKVEIPEAKEETISFNYDNLMFDISSNGMGLKNVAIKTYKDRDGEDIKIVEAGDIAAFATFFRGEAKAIPFQLKKLNQNEVLGTFENEQVIVEKKYFIDASNYKIETSISVQGKGSSSIASLQNQFAEKTVNPESAGFLIPSMDRQELFVAHSQDEEREIFSLEKPFSGSFKSVFTASLASHYFAAAVIDRSDILPDIDVTFDKSKELTIATLNYVFPAGNSKAALNYDLYIGPKDLDLLRTVDEKLVSIVDFGWFSGLAKPLLSLMKWLHTKVGNWGLAIIFLTILVRLVVLPFNVMSYKSMKKMQEIQPALKKVREKYKEDQVRMNQEVMALMKHNKVNPAGGCLPMLLQFPVFIALYRVLSESIELYQAPFGLWITDLSLKDPYYVLPVAMGICMFIQQKITPNTMDPAQQKAMMIMPVFFSLLMISLPSGLTLYIFISTLFGIIQQQAFMKKA
ncbi:MAG: membrane protein insertase YidC [Bdellovibrionales bacterium]